jgi:hypothetical protein
VYVEPLVSVVDIVPTLLALVAAGTLYPTAVDCESISTSCTVLLLAVCGARLITLGDAPVNGMLALKPAQPFAPPEPNVVSALLKPELISPATGGVPPELNKPKIKLSPELVSTYVGTNVLVTSM